MKRLKIVYQHLFSFPSKLLLWDSGESDMKMNHRIVESNKIKMHFAEDGEGPLVVFCHGWPESWYSWRHQLKALAEAGYRVVAPDQRGYGKTDRPEAVEDYNVLQLSGDIVGLVDALGEAFGHVRAGDPVSQSDAQPRTLRRRETPGGS